MKQSFLYMQSVDPDKNGSFWNVRLCYYPQSNLRILISCTAQCIFPVSTRPYTAWILLANFWLMPISPFPTQLLWYELPRRSSKVWLRLLHQDHDIFIFSVWNALWSVLSSLTSVIRCAILKISLNTVNCIKWLVHAGNEFVFLSWVSLH